MLRRIRLFTLIAIIGTSAIPTLTAETMGTNPKPRPAIRGYSILTVLIDVVFACSHL